MSNKNVQGGLSSKYVTIQMAIKKCLRQPSYNHAFFTVTSSIQNELHGNRRDQTVLHMALWVMQLNSIIWVSLKFVGKICEERAGMKRDKISAS